MQLTAYVITLMGHEYSEAVAERCINSGRDVGGISVDRFPAVSAECAVSAMQARGMRWTWGENGAGLRHHPYAGRLEPRLGCAMSHLLLWERCVERGEPLLILEHDAVFIRKLESFAFKAICQINDPAGATRRGQWWHEQMVARGPGVWPKTRLPQNLAVPDGLAGNSAYVIQPHAAQTLIELCHVHGVWPNDALMCAQLVPDLEERYPFITRVEQSMSTTGT